MEIGRKHPVHQPVHERPNEPVIIFLTVCTKGRKEILATEEIHEHLVDSWREARILAGRPIRDHA